LNRRKSPRARVERRGAVLASVARRANAVAVAIVVHALTAVLAWRGDAAVDGHRWLRRLLLITSVLALGSTVALRANANANAGLVYTLTAVETRISFEF
jgi:hypothetical protein